MPYAVWRMTGWLRGRYTCAGLLADHLHGWVAGWTQSVWKLSVASGCEINRGHAPQHAHAVYMCTHVAWYGW
jgi:hypothetical protein